MRLDKYLADCGTGTRKEIKSIIKSGAVRVNGKTVNVSDYKVNEESDAVELNGQKITYLRYHYYMMNKPSGVLSATEDKRQKTVLDLLSAEHQRLNLFPVGRLDKDTEGLLILTDDGEFAHKVMSPKSEILKKYFAETEAALEYSDKEKFRSGLILKDGTVCLPADLDIISSDSCIVTVMEGKYHQVKRMLASVGKPVKRLKRISIGKLELDNSLEPGEYRPLSVDELCKVYAGYNIGK